MQTVGILDRLPPRNELIRPRDGHRSVLSVDTAEVESAGSVHVVTAILNNRADLGLFLLSPNPETDLTDPLTTERHTVAVASPENPLAELPPLFPNEPMRDHPQFVVSDPRKRLFAWPSNAYWIERSPNNEALWNLFRSVF